MRIALDRVELGIHAPRGKDPRTRPGLSKWGPAPSAGTCSLPPPPLPPWLVSDGLPAGRGGCPFPANDRLRRQVMENPGGWRAAGRGQGQLYGPVLTGEGGWMAEGMLCVCVFPGLCLSSLSSPLPFPRSCSRFRFSLLFLAHAS